MGFDYTGLWVYLNEEHSPYYTEEEKHDKFVRNLYDKIKGRWPGVDLFRGPKLKDNDGYMYGRPDLVALREDFLAVIEAKVMRNKDTPNKCKRDTKPQLKKYNDYFSREYNILPYCYVAIKQQTWSNNYILKKVDPRNNFIYELPLEYALAR